MLALGGQGLSQFCRGQVEQPAIKMLLGHHGDELGDGDVILLALGGQGPAQFRRGQADAENIGGSLASGFDRGRGCWGGSVIGSHAPIVDRFSRNVYGRRQSVYRGKGAAD